MNLTNLFLAKLINKLYPYRFGLFLSTQLTVLFGSLIVPYDIFEIYISPVLFMINLAAGVLLVSQNRKKTIASTSLLAMAGLIFGIPLVVHTGRSVEFFKMGTLFLFYLIVTLEIIIQVWNAKNISQNVILGLISGYLSLGLIGFFLCLSIEMAHPNSFEGLMINGYLPGELTGRLEYFSYVTVMTVGYGDIQPVTQLSQKAAILIGLLGQFYMVIVTATIVGKYINQTTKQ